MFCKFFTKDEVKAGDRCEGYYKNIEIIQYLEKKIGEYCNQKKCYHVDLDDFIKKRFVGNVIVNYEEMKDSTSLSLKKLKCGRVKVNVNSNMFWIDQRIWLARGLCLYVLFPECIKEDRSYATDLQKDQIWSFAVHVLMPKSTIVWILEDQKIGDLYDLSPCERAVNQYGDRDLFYYKILKHHYDFTGELALQMQVSINDLRRRLVREDLDIYRKKYDGEG